MPTTLRLRLLILRRMMESASVVYGRVTPSRGFEATVRLPKNAARNMKKSKIFCKRLDFSTTVLFQEADLGLEVLSKLLKALQRPTESLGASSYCQVKL